MKRLRTVVVGFGSVASEAVKDARATKFYQYLSHAAVLKDHPRFEWVGVVDPSPEARKRAELEWGVRATAATVKDLPEAATADIAIVATRPDVRREVLEAMPALRGALIEKPLGRSLEEGRNVAAYCRTRSITATMNLFRRGEKTSRELSDGRFRLLVGHVQAATILYGRGLRNNALHMIDLLRFLGEEVSAVRALSEMRATESSVPGDAEAIAVLTLAGGGYAFLHPLDFKCYRDVLIDFWGTTGRLEIYQEGLFLRYSPLRQHRAIDKLSEIAIDDARVEQTFCGHAYYDMYTNLAEAVDGSTPLFCPLDEALRSEAVIEAIFASARAGGKAVRPDEV